MLICKILLFFLNLHKSGNFLTKCAKFFEPVLYLISYRRIVQFNSSKEQIDLIWNGSMRSDDFKR